MDKYLEILGISYGLTLDEIKKIYLKKAMEYHPDRNHGFKKEAEEKMKAINFAWDYVKEHFDEYQNMNFYKEKQEDDIFTEEQKSQEERVKESRRDDNKKPKEKKYTKEIIFSYFCQLFFSYKGRINRLEFIVAITIFISGMIFLLNLLMGVDVNLTTSSKGIVLIIFAIIFLFICILLMIKRLHDIDDSAFYILFLFAYPIGTLVIILLLFLKRGNIGDNRFGPPSNSLL